MQCFKPVYSRLFVNSWISDMSLLIWSGQDHYNFDHKFKDNVWQFRVCTFLRWQILEIGSSQSWRTISHSPSSCLHGHKISISCLDQIKMTPHLWMLYNWWEKKDRWKKRCEDGERGEKKVIERETEYRNSTHRLVPNSMPFNTKGENWLGRNNKGNTNSWREAEHK